MEKGQEYSDPDGDTPSDEVSGRKCNHPGSDKERHNSPPEEYHTIPRFVFFHLSSLHYLNSISYFLGNVKPPDTIDNH